MKTVILAGGLGTRISEESHLRPKPMIEIGGRPILWHIMKIYAAHGINGRVGFEGRLGRLEIEDQKLSGPRRQQVISRGGTSYSRDVMSLL